jgi:hypothetical protein
MKSIINSLSYYRANQYIALSAIKRKLSVICIVSAALILFYLVHNAVYTTQEKLPSPPVLIQPLLEKKKVRYNSVDRPCIEPHCEIECFMTYDAEEKNGTIHSSSLSEIQKQHLMIDMGKDSLVNDLISFIPPFKICPDHRQAAELSEKNISRNLEFYPLLFGFVDRYLYKTISRQILTNNQMYTVEQMCLPKKSMDFSELIPGKFHTYKYAFENEQDYRRMYSLAYFAVTMKKAGWDCNRHYEIISSGTIPYFDNLTSAGQHTLSLLPKSLLYEAQKLPGVSRENLTINHTLFDVNQYYLLLHRLLYYAKYRLTTTKIVEYILKVINYPLHLSSKHSVLFIAHGTCDFMKDFMLDGFTRVFEENLHVFQPPAFLYDYPASKRWTPEETTAYFGEPLYGSGFGFKLSLKKYFHLYVRDKKELPTEKVMQELIENKTFSLIVYGSIWRASSLLSIVTKHYERSRIVIIDGQDEGHMGGRADVSKQGYYFCREIQDDCKKFI